MSAIDRCNLCFPMLSKVGYLHSAHVQLNVGIYIGSARVVFFPSGSNLRVQERSV